MAKYQIKVFFGDIELYVVNTTVGRYKTDALEVVPWKILGEYGKGRKWTISHLDEEKHYVEYTDGKNVVYSRLSCFGKLVDDFEEEDKPKNSARFTVFGGGDPVPYKSVNEMAKVLSQVIFGRNKVQIS